MKLSQFKAYLQQNTADSVAFLHENGSPVPAHFHITEIGQLDKKFMDCGGKVRSESSITMQLWESVDFWHRLTPEKLLRIIRLSEEKLGIGDHDIEVEYQGETIGKFGVDFQNEQFILTNKNTACLANEACGVPSFKEIKEIAASACCSPNSGCC